MRRYMNCKNSLFYKTDFMIEMERLYLAKIKCRIIYNISKLSDNMSFSGLAIRVCTLQFSSPSAQQKRGLPKLVNSRATWPIEIKTFEQWQDRKQAVSN